MASGGMMAKGGKTEPDETVYIEYLNKAKKFAKDRKEFKGQNAYNEAVSWGRKNIGNFNLDMVKFKMASGGMMANGGIVAIEKKGDKKVATIIHNGNVFFVEYYIDNPEIKHIKGDDANTYFSVVDNFKQTT